MKPLLISDPLFMKSIIVFYRWDYADHKKYMQDHYGIESGKKEQWGAYHTLIERESDHHFMSVIFVSADSSETWSVCALAHEAVHAAFGLLDSAGVKPDPDNHEVYAYYTDMIVRQTLEYHNVQSNRKVKTIRRRKGKATKNRK